MPLPVVATPKYDLTLPISEKKITFRPFLVKEEKILLIASESKNQREILNSLRTVVTNCVEEDINIDELPLVDVEYLFLQLRARSVGEVVELIRELKSGEKVKLKVDLTSIGIKKKRVKSDIKLTDKIGIKLKSPTFSVSKVVGEDETEKLFDILSECVESIYDENGVYSSKDFTKKELKQFLESLTQSQFKLLTDYFEALPKLYHEVVYEDPKTKKKEKVVFNNIYDFF